MKTSKHLALAALLVVAVALVTSTSVLAQSTITLTNVADPADRDSVAWGRATLSDVADSDGYGESVGNYFFAYHVYEGYLTVSCSGLTPGATYRIGPTGLQGGSYQNTTYSSVKASNTGTVALAVQVSFVGAVDLYEVPFYRHNKPLFYFYVDTWYPGYSLSVARKQGTEYIEALQGSFPYPY